MEENRMAIKVSRLKCLRFFVRGHLKQYMYATNLTSLAELRRRITNKINQISKTMLSCVMENFVKHLKLLRT